MEIKMFLDTHVASVFSFEMAALSDELSDIQKEMKSWDQPWREESLNHYAQSGWSFVAENSEGEIQGYILAQPILFYNNWTQTLWVEHFSFRNQEVGQQLFDTILRWSKTKHLQKVILNGRSSSASLAREHFPKSQEGHYWHWSTTRLTEE